MTRRKQGLGRFAIRPQSPDETPANYAAYLKRKEAERAALQSRIMGGV